MNVDKTTATAATAAPAAIAAMSAAAGSAAGKAAPQEAEGSRHPGHIGHAEPGPHGLSASPRRPASPTRAQDGCAAAQVQPRRGKDLARLGTVLLHDDRAEAGPSVAPAGKRLRLESGRSAQHPLVPIPVEAASGILQWVAPDEGAHGTMRTLDALSLSSPSMRAALARSAHLRHKYRLLRVLSQAAEAMLAAQPPERCCQYACLAPLLGPPALDRLVASAIQSNHIEAMGTELQHLAPAQRAHLVGSALALPLGTQAASALQGLALGLAHLTPEQQGALVSAVLSLPLEHLGKGRLAEALVHLAPVQRNRVVNDLLADDDRALYIPHLAENLSCLETAERERIVDTALALRRTASVVNRGRMLSAIGGQAGHLDLTRRSAIARAALTDRSVSVRSDAIVGLAQAAAALTEAERNRLVAVALALPDDWHKPQALVALGEHARHFSPTQRHRLLGAMTRSDALDRENIIAAFGKSRTHLTKEENARLLAAARNLPEPDLRCSALASLGRGAEALGVLPDGTAAGALALDARIDGILALCQIAGSLAEADRQRLFGLLDAPSLWYGRPEFVEALSTQVSHFDDAQRYQLIDMVVLGLPDEPATAQVMAALARGINSMRSGSGPD